MVNKRLKIDWLYSLIAEMCARVGGLVIFLGYAKFLGAEAVGVALSVYAFAITTWLFIDLGLGIYGSKLAAEQRDDINLLQSEITICRFLLSIVCTMLFATCTFFILNAKMEVVLAFMAFLVFRSLAVDWRLRGEARFKSYAIVMIFASLFQLVFAIAFVRPENWSSTLAIPWAVYALTMFLGTWFYTDVKDTPIKHVRVGTAFKHIGHSIGFSLSNGVSVLFQQSPVLILSTVYGPTIIAGYALIHRVLLSSVLLFQVVGNAVFPVLVAEGRKSNALAMKITYSFMSITFVLAAVIVSFFSTVLFYFDFHEVYLPNLSLTSIVFLLAFYMVRCVRVPLAKHSFALGLQNKYARVNIIVFSVYLILVSLLFFFQSLSKESVSFFFLIGELAMLSFTMFYIRASLQDNKSWA